MITVEDAMQTLHQTLQGAYQPQFYSTTAREFRPDPILTGRCAKFEIDPVLAAQQHKFVLDTRFGGNDWIRTSNT